MFHHLEGLVSDIEQNLVCIDCGGMGFAVNATMNTISNISLGSKAKLYISEAIGEDHFDLYGFYSKSEKRCFELLTSVSGIGPKAGLSILSYNSPESLTLAIINNDVKALTVAPGVGKKIAQRVILELKDKIAKEFNDSEISIPVMNTAVATGGSSALNDAMAGLAVLGYSSSDIAPVLKTISAENMTAEEIIKAVLKQFAK